MTRWPTTRRGRPPPSPDPRYLTLRRSLTELQQAGAVTPVPCCSAVVLSLVRLPVGVSLTPRVSTVAPVPALVRRQLGVAVRTDEPQVLPSIVSGIAINVVKDEREWAPAPFAPNTAYRASAALGVGQVITEIMPLVAAYSGFTCMQPPLGQGFALGCLLASQTAVDPLTPFDQRSCAPLASAHAVDATATHRQRRRIAGHRKPGVAPSVRPVMMATASPASLAQW